MNKEQLQEGLDLLNQPILPIASMVQFFIMTGDFSSVSEIISELPESIETGMGVYTDPSKLLAPYVEQLDLLLKVKNGADVPFRIIDETDNEVDPMTAAAAIVDQQIMAIELEKINSVLCAPCGCRLCCVGPDDSMEQAFFEIPLDDKEVDLFAVEQLDSEASRSSASMAEPPLGGRERPFYERETPLVAHWQKGWSLILPENSSCPNLEPAGGRCLVYEQRPKVCRMPQIFPYVLEPVGEQDGVITKRIQRKLLAVVDCPYVQLLKDEINRYAAACELDLLFKQNKA